MVNFPTQITDCDSHSPALLDYFFLPMLLFVLWWLSLHWEILMWLSQFPFSIAYDYSCANWDGVCDHLRDVPSKNIFNFGASAAVSKFCEEVQVWIYVYIPLCKYEMKAHSATCAAVIGHRNHFFRLHQQYISSESKAMLGQASTCCK